MSNAVGSTAHDQTNRLIWITIMCSMGIRKTFSCTHIQKRQFIVFGYPSHSSVILLSFV